MSANVKRNSEILAEHWEKPPLPSGSLFDIFNAGAIEDGIMLQSIEFKESIGEIGTSVIRGIVVEVRDDLTTHLTRWFESRGCVVEMMRVNMSSNVEPFFMGRTPVMREGIREISFVAEVRNLRF